MAQQSLSRLLRRLLLMYPDGPMSISELSRRIGKPRATIHRHLKDGNINEDTLIEYAKALSPSGREAATLQELRVAAGYPVSLGEKEDEIRAIAAELANLDRAALDAFWQLLTVFGGKRTVSAGNHTDSPHETS
jgi:DNA-binding transcriptional ArsR family regulator